MKIRTPRKILSMLVTLSMVIILQVPPVVAASNNAKLNALTYQPTIGSVAAPVASVKWFSASQGTTVYNVELPIGSTSVTVAATKAEATATVQITPADGVISMTGGTGTAIVRVTAGDGTTVNTYTVNFTVASYIYKKIYRSNFEYYTSLINSSGSYGFDEFLGDLGRWNAKAQTVNILADPKDSFNHCAMLSTAGTNITRLNKCWMRPMAPFVFSGRINIDSTNTSPIALRFGSNSNQATSGKNLVLFTYDSAVGGYKWTLGNSATPSNATLVPGEWYKYNIYMEPAEDDGAKTLEQRWAASKLMVQISGGLEDAAGNPLQFEQTTLESCDIGYNGVGYTAAAGTGGEVGISIASTLYNGGCFYVDDVHVYQPGPLKIYGISSTTDVPITGGVTLSLGDEDPAGTSVDSKKGEFDVDLTTLLPENISVAPTAGGAAVPVSSITADPSKPDRLTLQFEDQLLAENTNYTVSLGSGLKGVAGNGADTASSKTFTTGAASARLSALTYQPNGQSIKTVTGFTETDDTKEYNVQIMGDVTSATVDAVAEGLGASLEFTPFDKVVDLSNGSGSAVIKVNSVANVRSNTYTIYFTVIPTISGLTINSPSNLIQASSALSQVNFEADTTPASNIAESMFEWYINGTKQPQTGRSFSYMPTGAGRYNVYSKIYGTDFQTETRTIVIDSAVAENTPVSSITLNPTELTLWADFAAPIQITTTDLTGASTVLPANATNPVVRWESSNPSVATIDQAGYISLVAPGITSIVAKSTDGTNITSNTLTLNVTPPHNRAANQKLNIDPSTTPRIDINQYLAWPQNVGDAQIALWSKNATGAFSITVDDSIDEDFETWKQWTRDYGFPFTFFVHSRDDVVQESYGNWQGLLNGGEDVQSHTFSHISAVEAANASSARTIREYSQPFEVINTLNGAKLKTIGFSYGYNVPVYSREFFIAGRGTEGYPNKVATVDYNKIKSISMSGKTNLVYNGGSNACMEGAVKSLYDTNYKVWNVSYYGGWTNLHSHGLTTPETNSDLGDGTTGKDVFNYIFSNLLKPASDAGKVWVNNFTNVAMYGQERDTAQLSITENTNSNIKFTLTDQMDDIMFDFPLTVKIKVNNEWSGISAKQNGVAVPVTEVEDSGSKYVMIEAVPDKGEVVIIPASALPEVTADDLNNTIIGINYDTMEYAISADGGEYGNYSSNPLPNLGGTKDVKVRMKAQGQTPAGADVILSFTPNAGDVSGDGIIDVSDVIMAAEIAVGATDYSHEQDTRANVSSRQDSVVDISDVVMIAERAVGGTNAFPVDLP